MPPHRRRPAPNPGQTPPIRRPKVAGLRNRPGQPAEDAAEQTTPPPAITDDAREEPERGSAEDRNEDRDEPEETEEDLAARRAAAEPPPVAAEEDPAESAGTTAETAEDPLEAAGTADGDAEGTKAARKARSAPVTRAGNRPAGKRRSTGSARPDDLASAETGAGTEGRARHPRVDDRPTRTRGQRQISVAIGLAGVAVVLAGLAVFFRGQADDLTKGDPNTALTDSAATSQIKGQLTNAIKQTFSYNYTDLGSTEKAVKENLVGKALCEYNLLFGEVKEYAPQQKIVLDTTVRELALVRIDGDRAEALVYIDQLSTRVDVNKTVAVGGQFAVQAAKDGDHWKITEFDMFGQPLFNGKPAPKC